MQDYDDEDELINQFERGHRYSEDERDDTQEHLYSEFTQKERDFYAENEEEEGLEPLKHNQSLGTLEQEKNALKLSS